MNANQELGFERRNKEIEILRGIAIAMVLWYHFSLASSIANLLDYNDAAFVGVELFFVISGYGIATSIMLEKEFKLKKYIVKRVYKIVPSLVAMVFIAGLLNYFSLHVSIVSDLFQTPPSIFIGDSIRLLLGILNLDSHGVYAYSSMWYLSVTYQFYAIIAVMAFLFKLILGNKRIENKSIFLTCFALLTCVWGLRAANLLGIGIENRFLNYLLIWKFDFLFIGVCIAYIRNCTNVSPEILTRKWNKWITVLFLLLPIVVVSYCESPLNTIQESPLLNGIGYPVCGISYGILLWRATFFCCFNGLSRNVQLALYTLGKYSYSLYLYNFVGLIIAWYFVAYTMSWAFYTSPICYGSIQLVIGMLIIAILSYVNHNVIEKCMNRYGNIIQLKEKTDKISKDRGESQKLKGRKNYIYGYAATWLVSIYSIAFFYLKNIGELNIIQILPLILGVSFLAILVYASMQLIVKDNNSGTVCSILVMAIIMNYSIIEQGLKWIISDLKYWHVLTILIWLTIGLILHVRKKQMSDTIISIVTMTIVGLLILNVFFAMPTVNNKLKSLELRDQEVNLENVQNDKDRSNIYYLIFDEYASNETVKKYFDYNNEHFFAFLRDNNFSVSETSYNYTYLTKYEVTNYINLDYVTYGLPIENTLDYVTQDALMYNLLSEAEYNIIGIGQSNWWSVPNYSGEDADGGNNTDMVGNSANELCLKQTIIYPFVEKTEYYVRAKLTNDTFGKICELSRENSEGRFIFSYLCTPHAPFIFDENGENVSYHFATNWEYYLGQYKFITESIMDTINEIIENDPNAVIILQSDHGARGDSRFTIEERDKTQILNAVYYKGEEILEIEGMSGVDTLRFIFNKILGTEFEMLGEYHEET